MSYGSSPNLSRLEHRNHQGKPTFRDFPSLDLVMGDFQCESNLFKKYKHRCFTFFDHCARKTKTRNDKWPSDVRALHEVFPTSPNCERLARSSRLMFARVLRVKIKMEEATGKEEELQKFLGKVDEIGKNHFGVLSDLHFAEMAIVRQ